MTEDGLMVFPGMVLDKDAVLATIAQAPPWTRFELSDVRVSLNGDIGVITYHADAQRAGSSPYRALMSSVYVLRDEAWRLVLHQQTPDPQAT
jgi:ketosteroid isomerase-like protein